MKIKRILACLLIVLMVGGLMACSGGSETDVSDVSSMEESSEAAPASSEETASLPEDTESTEDVFSQAEVSEPEDIDPSVSSAVTSSRAPATTSSAVVSSKPVNVSSAPSTPSRPARPTDTIAIKVISQNVLNNVPLDQYMKNTGSDNVEGTSVKERAAAFVALCVDYKPDVIGLQEVTTMWQSELKPLESAYATIYEYRDGPNTGEANPIYYRKDKFTLLDSGTFWLNETGEKYKTGWGASYIRICTWAKLKDNSTGREFAYFNTHLDWTVALLENGIPMIIDAMKKTGVPAFVNGDLNFQKYSKVGYQTFLKDPYIADAQEIATKTEPDAYTLHNFQKTEIDPENPSKNQIDFILVDSERVWCTEWKILREIPAGHEKVPFISDHYGLYAKLYV